jgi:FtsH-binding integral membrane protein
MNVVLAAGGIGQVSAFAARLTDDVTAVAASIAVLFIAVNGIRWTTSSGNPMRQADARSGLIAALVGLAVAVSANVIVNLILAALR